MGRSVHDHDDAVHLVDEFPFERANEVFEAASAVAEAIEPTAEIVDWLDAVHNLKARA